MHYKITYPCMPWELDYALLSFTQFKKSKYYLDEKDTIEINPSLNLSSYIVNWEKSKISKDLLISRFNQYLKLLEGYKVTPIIYEGDELYGHLDHQRDAMSSEVDFYISVCPDMYFSEHLLPLLINSSKQIDTKYFVLTPEIYKMWDNTWDEITNQDYLGVPYEEWNKGDIFDIRSNMKNSEKGVTLETTMRSKWAGWFDLFNKEMYENLVPIQKDWNGYGPWDWYSLMITEACKKNGVDFQQYILRGQTIFEYPIGPLLDGGYTKMYKDLLYLNEIPDQRKTFEFNMPQYVSDGVKRLKEKGIL
tara:strand:- start:6644 stop:7558 length:915 start_codon:yes stop_codon:yes gene_type:complete